eukprot:gene25046-5322_t
MATFGSMDALLTYLDDDREDPPLNEAASEALDLHSQQSPPVSPQTSAQFKASPEAAAAILCLVNPLLTYEAAADVVASNDANARELLADANTKLVKAAAISRQYY